MGDIFDIIKDKANRHESEVSADAWKQIIGEKRRRRPVAFWWLAASLLLISVGMGGYWLMNRHSSDQQQAVNNQPSNRGSLNTNPAIPSSSIADKNTATSGSSAQSSQSVNIVTESGQISTSQISPVVTSSTPSQDLTTLPSTQSTGRPVQKNIQQTDRQQYPVTKQFSQSSKDTGYQSSTNGSRKNKRHQTKSAAELQIQNGDWAENNDKTITQQSSKTEKKEIRTVDTNPSAPTETPVVSVLPQQSSVQPTETVPSVTASSSAGDSNKKTNEPLPQSIAKKDQKKAKNRTWSAEVALTPMAFISSYDQGTLFHRLTVLNDGKTEFTGKMSRSEIKPTVSLSAKIRKDINHALSVGIGLEYLRAREYVKISGAQVNTQFIIGEQHLNPGENPEWISDTIQSVSTQQGNIQSINRYSFLCIPLSLQYRFWQKKNWELALETGLTLHVATQYRNNLNTSALSGITSTQAYASRTNLGLNINAGLRVGRRINDRYSIFAIPYFGFNPFSQQIKNSMIDKRIHRTGVQIGASWKLW